MKKSFFAIISAFVLISISSCNNESSSTSIISSSKNPTSSIGTQIVSTSSSSTFSSSASSEPAHVHTFSDNWSFDNNNHWKNATCGHDAKKDFGPHNFVEHVVPPSYDAGGYTRHECSICGYSYDSDATDKLKYRIVFVDDNNNVLEEQDLYKGEIPEYHGEEPKKTATSQYTYSFIGWTPEIKPATNNEIYVATFSSETISYKVTWKNYDGEILSIDSCCYGDTPTYNGKIPGRLSDDIFHFYRFDGWDRMVEPIKEDTEYTAKFTYTDAYDISIYDSVSYKIDHCYINNQETIELPSSYTYEMPISVISENAFSNDIEPNQIDGCGILFNPLKKVIIPVTIKSIGKCAFKTCNHIESITSPVFGDPNVSKDFLGYIFGGSYDSTPETLKEFKLIGNTSQISSYALSYCRFLEAFTIPSCIKSIKNHAFYECRSLTSIVVPGSVEEIGEYAFANCYSLQNLTIPSSVVTIGNYIIDECQSLKNLTIPGISKSCILSKNNLPNLDNFIIADGSSTFSKYDLNKFPSITSVVIPEGVSTIGPSAFANCENIVSIKIPEGVTSIGSSAFSGCTSLSSIDLPNSLLSIGGFAFNNCILLKSIKIPSNATSIGHGLFAGCSSLESIEIPCFPRQSRSTLSSLFREYSMYENPKVDFKLIPKSLKSVKITNCEYISTCSFYNCSGLTSIEISGEPKSIGSEAFYGCSSIKEIKIPSSVSHVYENILTGCIAIETLTVPFVGEEKDKNTFISYYFGGKSNDSFYSYNIPSSLKHIVFDDSCVTTAENSLINCKSLVSISFPSTIQTILPVGGPNIVDVFYRYKSFESFNNIEGKNIFQKTNRHIVDEDGQEITDFVIPEDVLEIKKNCFLNFKNIKSVTVSNGVESISDSSFSGCSSLSSILLPDSLLSIGESAFAGCSSISSIHLPDSLLTIGNYAFDGCSSASIYVPDKDFSIGIRAFNNVKKVFFSNFNSMYSDNMFSKDVDVYLPKNTFEKLNNQEKINKNEGSFHLVNEEWQEIIDVVIPYGVTTINAYCFANYKNIKTITIPETVSTIGNSAFYNCSSLESINIPESITRIEANTFAGCSSISSLSIPKNVSFIGDGAFYDCTSLTSIELPIGITTLSSTLFYNCSSLKQCKIPDTVTEICSWAFGRCVSLESVIIPSTVNSIGEYAFTYCEKIEQIEIPDGVQIINDTVFRNCSSLKNVVLPNSVTSIGFESFYGCSSLESIWLPDSITKIGDKAFNGCSSLRSIKMPKGLKTTEVNSFKGPFNFLHVESVIIYDTFETLRWLPSEFADNVNVVYSSFDEYSKLNVSNYGTSIHLLDSEYNEIKTLEVPNGTTELKNDLLKGLDGIKNISICDSVTKIGDNVFYGCSSLDYLLLPQSIKTVTNNSFDGCNAKLFYDGTSSDYIGNGGIDNVDLNKLYFYSEDEPQSIGNYWHYVNGIPTDW